MRTIRRRVAAAACPLAAAGALTIGACTDSRPEPSAGQRIADVPVSAGEGTADHAQGPSSADRNAPSLARAGREDVVLPRNP